MNPQKLNPQKGSESLKRPQIHAKDSIQGTFQGYIQGSIQGNFQGSIQGTSQGYNQGTFQGFIQLYIQGTFQGSIQGTFQSSIQDTVQCYIQDSIQGTFQGSIQGTFQGVGDEGGARIDSSTFSAPQDSIPYRDTRTGKNTNTQLQYSLYWLLLRLV